MPKRYIKYSCNCTKSKLELTGDAYGAILICINCRASLNLDESQVSKYDYLVTTRYREELRKQFKDFVNFFKG